MNQRTRKILKENNLFEADDLSKHSQNVMTEIVSYLRVSGLSEYNQEVVRRDINNMVADGEGRGETVEMVIGRDYKSFCDEIIKSFPKQKNMEKILRVVNQNTLAISTLLFIWMVGEVIAAVLKKTSVYCLQITLGQILGNLIILIEVGVSLKYILPMAYVDETTVAKKVKWRKDFLLWLILMAIGFIPMCFYIFLKTPSFPIILPVAIALIFLPLILSVILERIESRRTN